MKAQVGSLRESETSLSDADADLEQSLNERQKKWDAEVQSLTLVNGKRLMHALDDRHALKQKPPLLMWDRRENEPLVVDKDEFWPAVCLSHLLNLSM
jgi:hypothetical protein